MIPVASLTLAVALAARPSPPSFPPPDEPPGSSSPAEPAPAPWARPAAGEQNIAIPEIRFDTGPFQASAVERARIAKLIDGFSALEGDRDAVRSLFYIPAFGLQPPCRLPGRFGAPSKHPPDAAAVGEAIMRELVNLGPKALPQLLDGLLDTRPTGLVWNRLEHTRTWFGREVGFNPANQYEADIHTQHDLDPPRYSTSRDQLVVDTHTITVADFCFATLGRILNRKYRLVRCQPTGLWVINSPAQSPEIAHALRQVWSSPDSARLLFDSLWLDYHSRRSRDFFSQQPGAVQRLLSYFPEQTASHIADRVRSLDLTDSAGPNHAEHMRRNGIEASYLIRLVRPYVYPEITDALVHVMANAQFTYAFAYAVTPDVVDREPDLVLDRAREFLRDVPREGTWAYLDSEARVLLEAAALYFPARAAELWTLHARHDTLRRLVTTICALKNPVDPQPWMITYLASLLDHQTPTGPRFGPRDHPQPARLCDIAAEVLANDYLDGVEFHLTRDYDYLDEQIDFIKQHLAANCADVPESADPRRE